MSNTQIGVDGCKAGWLFVRSRDGELNFGVVAELADLLIPSSESIRIFVDIPIGLRNSSCKPRACDVEARKLIGPRRSSVFPAPRRELLSCNDYAEANNLAKSTCGKGLSKQAFNISPKIREVDGLLHSDLMKRHTIREVHPELCFCGLNGFTPMMHKKKSAEGFTERMDLLGAIWPESTALAHGILAAFPRKHVAEDDVPDALVALVTALAPEGNLRVLPSEPESDDTGLPMEMVYAVSS